MSSPTPPQDPTSTAEIVEETKDFKLDTSFDDMVYPEPVTIDSKHCDLCGGEANGDCKFCVEYTLLVCDECLSKTQSLKLRRQDGDTWKPIVTDEQLAQNPELWIRFHALFAPTFFRDVVVQCIVAMDGDSTKWNSLEYHVFVASVIAGDVDLFQLLLNGVVPLGDHPVFEVVRKQGHRSDQPAIAPYSPSVNPAANHNEAIRLASQFGRLACLRVLVKDDRVDPADSENRAILCATLSNQHECVKLLLQDGRAHSPYDAVELACKIGHAECLKLFLEDHRAEYEENDHYLLVKATELNDPQCLKLLLNDGRTDPSYDDHYAFHSAIEHGHAECVKMMLDDHLVDPCEADAMGVAVRCDEVACLEVLLNDGREDPGTYVEQASMCNATKCLKLLLSDDRVNADDGATENLLGAAFEGGANRIKMLLEEGRADPSARGYLAVRRAHENGFHECVELFLNSNRVNLSELARSAAITGTVKFLELLRNDPRVDTTAADGLAVQHACQDGHHKDLKFLLSDPRVDPSVDDNYAVRVASQNGYGKCLKLLLKDRRVDPSADDNYAVRSASENGHEWCLKLLLGDRRVDPSADNNYAVWKVPCQCFMERLKLDPDVEDLSYKLMELDVDHKKCLKLLLNDRRVDPSAENNAALRNAAGDIQFVNLLVKDKRVQADVDILRHFPEKRSYVCKSLLSRGPTLKAVVFWRQSSSGKPVDVAGLNWIVNWANTRSKVAGMLCMGGCLSEDLERQVLEKFCDVGSDLRC